MYGQVEKKSEVTQTAITYQYRNVVVPRCKDCHSRHKLASVFQMSSLILLILALIALEQVLYGKFSAVLTGIIFGVLAGLAFSSFIAQFVVQKGIHSLKSSKRKYPEVAELRRQCYRFGKSPKDQIPQEDDACEYKPDKNAGK